MSKNLGNIFLPLAPKIFSNVDKNTILMTKEWNIIFVGFIDV